MEARNNYAPNCHLPQKVNLTSEGGKALSKGLPPGRSKSKNIMQRIYAFNEWKFHLNSEGGGEFYLGTWS